MKVILRVIFVHLEKAFDTVDHNKLLKKLDHYGARGTLNKWFESYLTDRKQSVSINGFNSNISAIASESLNDQCKDHYFSLCT